MVQKEEILKALTEIIDPDLHKDIVSLGFIKELVISGSTVSFAIELTTPACPVKNQFKMAAEKLVGELEGVKKVHVTMTARNARNDQSENGPERSQTNHRGGFCQGRSGKINSRSHISLRTPGSGL